MKKNAQNNLCCRQGKVCLGHRRLWSLGFQMGLCPSLKKCYCLNRGVAAADVDVVDVVDAAAAAAAAAAVETDSLFVIQIGKRR